MKMMTTKVKRTTKMKKRTTKMQTTETTHGQPTLYESLRYY